jgi:signal transduction histidine kinase
LVNLPDSVLQKTGNRLDLRVLGQAQERVSARLRGGGLSALTIGPQLPLAEQHATQVWWNNTALQLVAVTLLVLGGYLVVLGTLNRREAYLTYFGLLCLGWALLSARIWMRHVPLHSQWVEWLAASLVPWVAAATVQFLLSYAGRRSRILEWGLVAQLLLVPLSLWLAGPQRTYLVSTAWYLLLSVEVIAAMAIYWVVARHEGQSQWRSMAVLLGCLALVILLEVATQYHWLPLPPQLYAQWGVPAILIVMAFRLLYRFEHNLAVVEAGRATLERRVRDATAEIERNFAQLAELRVEQVTEKERKRIAADLHDDLGAKLLTIVHTSESDRISTLAREALEEMRLSVRGLTGKPVRLADALADWRAETVSRLGQTNIEADWSHPHEDLDQLLPARAYVQTTRIMREAVSNIIKHSGATLCKVRCSVGDHEFGISIQDNGRGIPMELDGKLDRGHGMASMKHRAKQLQGQCLVESGPGYGTVIRLTLPL